MKDFIIKRLMLKKKKKSYFKGKEERRYRVREKQKGSKVSGRT